MNMTVTFTGNERYMKNLTITGPDLICIPVGKYVVMRLVNGKLSFNVEIKEDEPET